MTIIGRVIFLLFGLYFSIDALHFIIHNKNMTIFACILLTIYVFLALACFMNSFRK